DSGRGKGERVKKIRTTGEGLIYRAAELLKPAILPRPRRHRQDPAMLHSATPELTRPRALEGSHESKTGLPNTSRPRHAPLLVGHAGRRRAERHHVVRRAR